MKLNFILFLLFTLSFCSMQAQKTFDGSYLCKEDNSVLLITDQGYGMHVKSEDEYYLFKYWDTGNDNIFKFHYYGGEEYELLINSFLYEGITIMEEDYSVYTFEKKGEHGLSQSDINEIKQLVNETAPFVSENTYISNSDSQSDRYSMPMVQPSELGQLFSGYYTCGEEAFIDLSSNGSYTSKGAKDAQPSRGLYYVFANQGYIRFVTSNGLWSEFNYQQVGNALFLTEQGGTDWNTYQYNRISNTRQSTHEQVANINDALNYFFQGEGQNRDRFTLDGYYDDGNGTIMDLHLHGTFKTQLPDGSYYEGSYGINRDGKFESMNTAGYLTTGTITPEGNNIMVTVGDASSYYYYKGPSRIRAVESHRMLNTANALILQYNSTNAAIQQSNHRINMSIINAMNDNTIYVDQYGSRVW